MIELGQKVKDSISGFLGIATCRAEYLYGCIRIQITPSKIGTDGKPIEAQYFDEEQCIPQKKGKTFAAGGPKENPPERRMP